MQVRYIDKTTTFNASMPTIINPSRMRQEKMMKESCARFGNVIGRLTSELEELTRNADTNHFKFLRDLVNNYQMANAGKRRTFKESSDYVINIYKMVENPTPEHSNIVLKNESPLEKLEEIFSLAKDEKTLTFVQRLQQDILRDSEDKADQIIKLLRSPNRESFVNDLDEFISYLKLNKDNPNAVKTLDTLLANGKYDRKKYDAGVAVNHLMKNMAIKSLFEKDKEVLSENYTEERGKFLKDVVKGMNPKKISESSVARNVIVDIYKTLTNKNVAIKEGLVEKFSRTRQAGSKEELESISRLFSIIDSNPEAGKFIEKSINKDLKVDSAAELYEVVTSVPLKKANIFFNNAKRIIQLSEGEERKAALVSELENPFFTPVNKVNRSAFRESEEGIVSKMLRYFENQINIVRYKHSKSSLMEEKIAEPVKSLKIKETPKQRKIRLSKEVNDYIKTILREKTYAKQQGLYSENATKIRLKLLPEIFASISETSKKAASKGRIAKTEALKLYQRINGKNRKTVRYMLKLRNKEGNRVFNVKEMISYIDDINSKIKTLKLQNKDFRASDAKALYETEYQNLFEKYDKLKN